MLNVNVKLLGIFYFKNLIKEKTVMNRVLLKETKIGENMAVGFEQDEDEIGLTIGSYNSMTIYSMEVEVWKKFVQAVNRANIIQKLEELD